MRRTARPEGALLSVRVQPRARRMKSWAGRATTLRVRVTAPPIDGRANDAVVVLLAEVFGVPRSSIELVSGATSRTKLFRFAARSLDDLHARLDRRVAGAVT